MMTSLADLDLGTACPHLLYPLHSTLSPIIKSTIRVKAKSTSCSTDPTLPIRITDTEEAKMDSAFVLASDPRVEPPVDNEQEKIEQLKEVVSRIQDRNCELHQSV
jgi:hypothetical protein